MKKAFKITLIAIGALCTAVTIFYVAAQTRAFPRIETARHKMAVERAKAHQPAQIDTIRPYSMTAQRGNILDCNGNVLAKATTVYDIHFDATVWKGDDWDERVRELSVGLADILQDKSASEYFRYISRGRIQGKKILTIGKGVDSLSMEQLKTLPFFACAPAVGGMIVEPRATRTYPYGALARRTIGFVRPGTLSYNTHIGIEGSCDSLLAGFDGYIVIKSKWRRKPFRPAELKKKEIARKEPVNGTDVQTTLDIELQSKADSVLRSKIEGNAEIEGACLVLADVKTGAIRSMVNLVKDGEEDFKEYYNVSIGRSYEPGQILRPAVEIAASKCGTEVFSIAAIKEGQEQAFVDTLSNIIRGGSRDSKSWDIAGLRRVKCVSPSSHEWSETSLEAIGKGFCVQAPALDYLALYTALGRRGEGVGLYLIEGCEPQTYFLCSKEKTEALTTSLIDAASKNSAFADVKHTIAGQTGSSFVSFSNGRYVTDEGRRAVQSTFAGFFPVENPQYSVICMVYTRPSYRYASAFGIPSDVVAAMCVKLHSGGCDPSVAPLN